MWQEQYKKDHPGATKAEIDKAFDSGIQGLETWKANYLRDHPGATDTQIEAAFNEAWAQKK